MNRSFLIILSNEQIILIVYRTLDMKSFLTFLPRTVQFEADRLITYWTLSIILLCGKATVMKSNIYHHLRDSPSRSGSFFHRIRIEESKKHTINESISSLVVHLYRTFKEIFSSISLRTTHEINWKSFNAPPVFSHIQHRCICWSSLQE